MSAPNIKNSTSLYGKTAAGALTTSLASMLSNAASSNKLIKIVSLIVSNVDGTNSADVTVNYNTAAAIAGTNYALAKTIVVPADASIVVISKDAPVYLEEDKSIGGLASASGDLEYVLSYEEYDDA